MEFCAHCAVNMFQNISNGRTNLSVTKKDFGHISAAAFLPFFGGGTKQYGTSAVPSYMLGMFAEMTLICVVGVAKNRAKLKWAMANVFSQVPSSLPTRKEVVNLSGKSLDAVSIINARCAVNQEYDSDFICPGLKITAGEIKMIVDISINFFCKEQNEADFAKKLGLLLIIPQKTTLSGQFGKVTVFTPKSKLFGETPPN
jgi:hypothetical protein